MGYSTHNLSKTTEYRIWIGIKSRCYDKNKTKYCNYGGRGIKMCDRWLNSFENFLKDVGPRPSKDYTLDRIDNNGNYEPSNCRWATKSEQDRNKRTNNWITANGRTRVIRDWANDLGVPDQTIKGRLKRGWSPDLAVSIPPKYQPLINRYIPAKIAYTFGHIG